MTTLKTKWAHVAAIIGAAVGVSSCSDPDRLPLDVELGGRTVSKLPYVIAYDQGLFEKYGLDVTLKLAPRRNGRGIRANPGGDWRPDIFVDGLTPNIVKQVERARFPDYVAVASNDCIVRNHIIVRDGIESLEDLKGMRIGISGRRDTTTGFAALELARRMNWDPDFDISIQFNGRDVEDLDFDRVDAIMASETRYADALLTDYRVLEDTEEWKVAVGGNSAMADADWLAVDSNREKARRFVQATVEGLALFHNDKALALDVMSRWYGIDDPRILETIYSRGVWMPKKPYPCYEGTENTLEMYDSLEMRKYSPDDFYDDSFVRELDESGFIDNFYN